MGFAPKIVQTSVAIIAAAVIGSPPSLALPQVSTAADERGALIATAFQIASRIPANPHARDRAKMQELVAQTCIDLSLLDEAATYAKQIQDWRRGEALALIGQQWAKKGDAVRALEFAEAAKLVAAGEQDWKRERVSLEVSRIYVRLGKDSQAYTLMTSGSPAALGALEVARTESMPTAQLDATADLFDKAIATRNFDLARGAVDGYIVWLGRVVDDEPRRTRALAALNSGIPGLPFDLQVTSTLDVAKTLYARGQLDLATTQFKRAQECFSQATFLPEDAAPLGVVVARTRFAMGDREVAASDLQRLFADFESHQNQIVDMRQARSLRSLAEAFAEFGMTAEASDCYTKALEAGLGNPNSRPRAEDLCATCLSMARASFQPSATLLARIESIKAGLSDPW